MTHEEFCEAVGRQVSATDQMPGFYTDRRIGVTPLRARKGAPVQAVRIVYNEYDGWGVFVNGEIQHGSGASDPMDIPFILAHGPFWPATKAQYDQAIEVYREKTREDA